MEELRSTEVLEKEILEDARRKAQRILKTADDTASSSAATWEKRTQRVIARAKIRYGERLRQSRREIMARLPLDKRRSRLEQIENFLRQAAEECIAGLSRETITALLERELSKRIAVCPELRETPFEVRFRGLSDRELEGLLGKFFPPETAGAGGSPPPPGWTAKKDLPPFTAPGCFPALILNAEKLRITVSLDGAADALLRDKRFELAAALLGQAVLTGSDAAGPEAGADAAEGEAHV
jgi:hypothetical protein